jgi:hypothetical protein
MLLTNASEFVAKVRSDVFVCRTIYGEHEMATYIKAVVQDFSEVGLRTADNEEANM